MRRGHAELRTQNEITAADAESLVRSGCVAVAEGANMPTTPGGGRPGVQGGGRCRFAPGKAANAGGVATSALEMQQNAARDSWSFEYSENRLREDHARHPPAAAWPTADEYGSQGDSRHGANIAGFSAKVADAMLSLGLI